MPIMGQPVVQVDAFTETPFAGNPAAVCVLPATRPDAWMQAVAREMSLPETAFLVAEGDGFRLRWFTPTVEVDLCGHATLASAHVLWETGVLPAAAPARFLTRSGLLTATRRGDWIAMDFPAEPATAVAPPPALLPSLGVDAAWVGRNRFDYLVEVATEALVRGLAPDLGRLASVETRGVIVTAPGQAPHDLVSRFFAPRAGIPEDPVTGSAHCCLGPYWEARLGKADLLAYQASARGGTVRVRVAGPRVELGGRAVTVLRGELLA
jgi:predicted PhzF superfamily epimerase YddE/YHI9